jgi:hypothetical protein
LGRLPGELREVDLQELYESMMFWAWSEEDATAEAEAKAKRERSLSGRYG